MREITKHGLFHFSRSIYNDLKKIPGGIFQKNISERVSTMRFKVKLTTKGGGKRELEIDATSVQDARDQASETYKGCTIQDVDLMPKAGYVRLYSHGEQTEVPVENIYRPF